MANARIIQRCLFEIRGMFTIFFWLFYQRENKYHPDIAGINGDELQAFIEASPSSNLGDVRLMRFLT